MTYSTNEIEDFTLPLPITQTARRIAHQFASLQPTPQKAEQVRLNTLAVYVVNDYDSPDTRRRRAKLIDLGMQLSGHPVALIVEIIPESERNIDVLLQVHPTGNEIYLPPLLQLTVLDESGSTFLEAQARSADNYIQLEFSGNSGERFSVKVSLGDASITEDFVL